MPHVPIHPGEILADELLEIGLCAAQLARILEILPTEYLRLSQVSEP